MNQTIGITGGIGSGKSVVARICRSMGFPVYDCDLEAKRLMDSSSKIKHLIKTLIHDSCVDSLGIINRNALSEIVFKDSEKLKKLNEIVHGAVRDDFEQWRARQTQPVMFVETAIPLSSLMDKMMNRIWLVEAPAEKRIRRVEVRNGLSKSEVEKRIQAQNQEFELLPESKTSIIENDGDSSLLLRINELLNEL